MNDVAELPLPRPEPALKSWRVEMADNTTRAVAAVGFRVEGGAHRYPRPLAGLRAYPRSGCPARRYQPATIRQCAARPVRLVARCSLPIAGRGGVPACGAGGVALMRVRIARRLLTPVEATLPGSRHA